MPKSSEFGSQLSIGSNSSKSSNKSESVKVIVRCRPMSDKEVKDGHKQIIDMYCDRGVIQIHKPNVSEEEVPKSFTFDAVYDWNSNQNDLYEEIFRPLVDSVLEGFNGTVFAYGQTGTGKTYTMEGDPQRPGVIPNSFEQIFNCIARSQNQQYLVRSSYLEIYQEEIRDLLAKDQSVRFELKERPDIGVYVKDLSSFVCKSIKEIEHVMTCGHQNRSVGATNMNEHSSRSHAIFIITIEHTEEGIDGQNHIRVGKLNLVDLAGSERQAKTGTVGQRQKEAIKINLSLSALGNVISSLVDGKSTHIPYRDSKLTRLLQDSLGGNAKTVMVANIGPASYNYEETLTTLRYANRAKNIKNNPRVNEDPKDALLKEFQSEIVRLKQQLLDRRKQKENRLSNGINIEEQVIHESKEIQPIDTEAVEKLQTKIKAMESKLLVGGKNIVDHTNEQQIQLEIKNKELIEQKKRERQMLQKLEEQEESTFEYRETFTSLQQEVEIKRRKLKKLVSKLQSVKTEIMDVQESNARERRELEQMQNDLMKELKLKYIIIDNFIPIEEKNKLLSHIVFDEEEDDWKIKKSCNNTDGSYLCKRPNSCFAFRYPTSEFARMAQEVGSGLRYRCENIMDCELELSSRMTKDYTAPRLSPRVRAALENALKREDDIDVEISSIPAPTSRKKGKKKETNGNVLRPLTAFKISNRNESRNLSERPDTAGANQSYPTARGLIRK
ncbi:kinesin-like protein KIF3B [Oppia nitens]|uniref:kinesin-like protein KIF3B n=1 Tax=Oppia nitens TaxID=1686743 RepID=UPI0023DBEC97|nr:kinesin-like protein KIF3B [Oppia nitens]